jgi:hypothetical protein
MLKFYFDLRYDDEPWSDDETGNDFAGVEEARLEAIELMAEITKDKLREYWRIAIRARNDQRTTR